MPSTEQSHSPCGIVGIGASAGGHLPLEILFTQIPSNTGLAFVVVMHLSPKGPSHLVEMLRHYTTMDILCAEESMELRPNTIYTIPPGSFLSLKENTFHLEPYSQEESLPHPIDYFFQSLAQEHKHQAIGVILSGYGKDGAQGVRQIKKEGGIVIVQEPGSAVNRSMPEQAIATGSADLIFPAEEIAPCLQNFAKQCRESTVSGTKPPVQSEELSRLFAQLKEQTGHDFSGYKRNTLLRRIDRRMMVKGRESFQEYLQLLEENADEAEALYQELLIGVTQFFRDPEAFDRLRTVVIPQLFVNRHQDDPIRIWHACCATGEEAYSVAILLLEHLQENNLPHKIQIFATDLDEAAINQARAGVYSRSIEQEVSQDCLNKYFTFNGETWNVAKQLREMIVFAQHNIIKDPPFSRLDMLVCRNFLIYLNQEMQKQLIALFHQVLHPGRFLFLGSAESVGLQSNLFGAVDKKWKIFSRQNGEHRQSLPFPFFGPIQRVPGLSSPGRRPDQAASATPSLLAERLLLERYVPARVIINERNEVIHFSKQAGTYLLTPEGEPTRDLLKLVHDELRPALRAAIYKTFAEHKENQFPGIKLTLDERELSINLIVLPLTTTTTDEQLAVVLFEPAPPPLKPPSLPDETLEDNDTPCESVICHLEEQLRVTTEQLLATGEQLESSNEGFLLANEELMATNEELQSANEELQATNEELETSKEELQALNEELITVNVELQGKIEELDQTNTDLENLFTSAEIATIFLDSSLHIKRYSPAMATLCNLIPADIGRPFRHLSGVAKWTNLSTDTAQVLQSQQPLEREVALHDDTRSFIMRILPYRNADTTVTGVVLTLVDITQRKQMEMALEENAEHLKLLIDQAPVSLAMFDREMHHLQVSRRWMEDFKLGDQNIIGTSHYEVFPEIPPEWREAHRRGLQGELLQSDGDLFVRQDGSKQWVRWKIRPWKEASGAIGGIVIFAEDISTIKAAEEILHRYELLAEHSQDIILFVDHTSGRLIEANPKACRAYGYSREELLTLSIHDLRVEDVDQLTRQQMDTAERQGILFETLHRRRDGSTFVAEVNSVGAHIHGQRLLLSIVRDITERKQAALQAARLASIVASSDDAIISKNLQGVIQSWNTGAERLFGYTAQEIIGQPITKLIPQDLLIEEQKIQQTLSDGGRLDHFETVRLTKDGTRVDVSLSVAPLFDYDNKVIGISKIARDISEKIRSARALEQSEERLRQTLKATSEAIWDWDLRSGRMYRSSHYYDLVHRNPAEDPHDYAFFLDVIHPDNRTEINDIIEAHKRRETPRIECSFRLNPLLGKETWLKLKGKAILRDEAGAPLRIVGTLADVTHIKQQEQALLRSEQHRTLALEAAQAGTWEWELATGENLWSDEVWALYNLKPHSCRPCYASWLATIYPQDRAQVVRQLEEAVKQQVSFRLEWRVQRNNGSLTWLMAKGKPTFTDDKTLEKFTGVVMDITERKENEISRTLLETQLQQSQKMEAIGTLAGGIAHDFNNILAAIMGYAEMAKDKNSSQQDISKDLDKVLEAGGRATNLVRQILAFSRQSQTKKVFLEPVHMIKEAIKLLRPALPATITIAPIRNTSQHSILADPTQIHQVVMNLCTNAFHAMEVQGGELRIALFDVTLSQQDLTEEAEIESGDFVCLSIGDTGPGIAPEIMEKIFDPYFTTKEVGRGTGLGLSIVHGIVTAAKGGIRCTSREGVGTTFEVFFPAVHQVPEEPPETNQENVQGNEHILVIDDEPMLVEMQGTMLTLYGYTVTTCTNADEALGLFQQNPDAFDAVITDQTMPGMTGMELSRELLRLRPELPIILCTGYSSQTNKEKARENGIKGFAFKPLANKELVQLLRSVLDSQHQRTNS